MTKKYSKESDFQKDLIKEIYNRFDGCLVLKNDPTYIQGIPDLLVLYKDNWAALECKESSTSTFRKNQPYYINKCNEMSYASVIYPENKEKILNEMEQSLEARESTRLSRSK